MQQLELLLVDEFLLGVALVGGGLGAVVVLVAADEALGFVHHLADDVDGDAVYEGTQLRVEAEARQGHVEFDEDLLGDFLYLKLVAAEFIGQVGHDLLVFLHDEGVQFGLACQYSLYYLLVFHGLKS